MSILDYFRRKVTKNENWPTVCSCSGNCAQQKPDRTVRVKFYHWNPASKRDISVWELENHIQKKFPNFSFEADEELYKEVKQLLHKNRINGLTLCFSWDGYYGEAICSGKDQFNKSMGRLISANRLVKIFYSDECKYNVKVKNNDVLLFKKGKENV
jgi:hypothetical protein